MQQVKAILCADDWGFSPGINEGILELARRGLLYSVSCAANSDFLEFGLTELLTYQEVGLKFNIHFNLTYKSPLNNLNSTLIDPRSKTNFYTFSKLIANILLSRVSTNEVCNEFECQLIKLRDLKIPIEGLDGHHHIHLIPFIFKSIASRLTPNGIKNIRTMCDFEHKPTYLQGLYFSNFLSKYADGATVESCGYILSKNIISMNTLRKKLSRFNYLIVHPAKFNDFNKFNMTDPLQDERINELNALLRYFND